MKRVRKSPSLLRENRRRLDPTPKLVDAIYSSIKSPVSENLATLLKSGKYFEIVSASVNPMDYTNADTFRLDYLCCELMSKYPHWDIGVNRSEAALEKWLLAERMCSETNARLTRNCQYSHNGITASQVIMTCRRKISNLLGPCEVNELPLLCGFGPGATTSLNRRHGDAYFKFEAATPHCTSGALALAEAFKRWNVQWTFQAQEVDASRLVFVPKNSKVDRAIAIEPDLNIFFQKGIGKMLRNRLRKVGLLKRDAQETNQDLARQGSIDGSLATIDLSSASDTVSLELIHLLLPPDWVELLSAVRTQFVLLPNGDKHLLRKWSSMGNGYTFELETLIFWGISASILELMHSRERRLSVFGDDIILDGSVASVLIAFLRYFGFKTNEDKTYATGPFRESCGKHYFQGTDVTPFYIRDRVDRPARYYWLANTIKRYSTLLWGKDGRFRDAWETVFLLCPRRLRFPVPHGFGDGGFVMDFDEALPRRARGNLCGFHFKAMVTAPARAEVQGHGLLVKSLWNLEKRSAIRNNDLHGEHDLETVSLPFTGGESGHRDVILQHARRGEPSRAITLESHRVRGNCSLVQDGSMPVLRHAWLNRRATLPSISAGLRLAILESSDGGQNGEIHLEPVIKTRQVIKERCFFPTWISTGPWLG
jgi:hypothetical protein